MPTNTPRSIQFRLGQSTSFQTLGSNQKLAATSRIRMDGTTSTGGRTRDRLSTAIMENPKPLYPRTTPASNMARHEKIMAPISGMGRGHLDN